MRARNIKPGFFENEELHEVSVCARLMFIGLWCMADREGRLEDRPKKIKLQLMPYDGVDTEKCLEELRLRGFLVRYQVDSQRFIQIENFLKHQHPHPNETPSSIPPPDKSNMADRIELAQALMSEVITEDDAGISIGEAEAILEEAGLLPKTSYHGGKCFTPCNVKDEHTQAGSLIPDTLDPDVASPTVPLARSRKHPGSKPPAVNFDGSAFTGVTEEHKTAWSEAYPACNIPIELLKAAEWVKANPTKKKKNWYRFLVNWLARTQEKGGDKGNSNAKYKDPYDEPWMRETEIKPYGTA